ncbi:hypothetical protein D0Z07_7113 [Hyphodiscus hymeniophilus]|uniref:Ribosome assembly protein 3 n=1 Tax=Hyphodiscus hymeniophilus TaxID=353542 RepID=A0A9P6VFU0_9HELO|nr:hypothetical protein D0Z07_7113 [Hyphodiscus hymeniophilus]
MERELLEARNISTTKVKQWNLGKKSSPSGKRRRSLEQKVVILSMPRSHINKSAVFSSESESEGDSAEQIQKSKNPEMVPEADKAAKLKEMSDPDIHAAFTKYYMQQATTEFAEDLDKVREADDFKEDALQLLIKALQQGTEGFSIDEQKRVVTAGMEKKE